MAVLGGLLQPATLLGCNVYITAGGLPRHVPFLLDLLTDIQNRCSLLTNKNCVVVHAFSDVVYNRSSIHLAGTTEASISTIASDIVREARQRLEEEQLLSQSTSAHPSVGLVDHVSVMPLHQQEVKVLYSPTEQSSNDNSSFQAKTSWGRAARAIGRSMTDANVLYYGDADPNQTSLAEVRRHKTRFFQSVGLEEESSPADHQDTATVGAPCGFVENYNIRLQCSKTMAQSLTKFVRERDGGLKGVEALTLPYNNRYEVACNLTQPSEGSSSAIDAKVREWMSSNNNVILERAYRVGTTANQCQTALELASNNERLQEHNADVRRQLKEFLSN